MKKNSYLTVTDQFCGAGGSSEGVVQLAKKKKLRGGIQVKMALNHWKLAIETHNTNHPDTDHDCTDISACDPRRYPSTDILITSPECTNHSLAKGKKTKVDLFTAMDPAEERSRATMWDVVRFAEVHNYNVIIVENVVDARSWVCFDAWLKAMHAVGYNHECVYLNSQHAHPTPQSRDRMYVVFWKKGNKAPDLAIRPRGWCQHCAKETETFQAWKRSDRKFGKYRQQYVFRCPTCSNVVEPYYYAAFNCIDWSIPGTRIGDREKPLSENTLSRIRYGIDKYWNHPQIITGRYTSGIECRVKDALNDVMPTQPGDASHAILNPLIINRSFTKHPRHGPLVKDASGRPLPTMTTVESLGLLSPLVMNGEYDTKSRTKVRDGLKDPAFTQTTRAMGSVVMPFMIELKNNVHAKEIADALGTILAGGNHHGIVSPIVTQYNGKSESRGAGETLNTLSTRDRFGLITPASFQSFMTWYYNGSDVANHITEAARTFATRDRAGLVLMGEKPKLEDCYYRMLVPQEVKRGMAFREDYVILGNGREQVKQCGNAVTPPAMELLIERCADTLM